MTAQLSDHLRATRDILKAKRSTGLFLLPCALGRLVKRFNSLIALAEEQEAELRLAQAIVCDLPQGQTATIIRFPKKTVIVTSTPGGDDAA